jgi:hypothetical protein
LERKIYGDGLADRLADAVVARRGDKMRLRSRIIDGAG